MTMIAMTTQIFLTSNGNDHRCDRRLPPIHPCLQEVARCPLSPRHRFFFLDTGSPPPLFNSHPLRLLYLYLSRPSRENPAFIYGLLPPNSNPPPNRPHVSIQNISTNKLPTVFLSLSNASSTLVSGEANPYGVVQAGTLDVVGCILEAWLASKRFATGSNSSASGVPRET